jgi:hypothetical protein
MVNRSVFKGFTYTPAASRGNRLAITSNAGFSGGANAPSAAS